MRPVNALPPLRHRASPVPGPRRLFGERWRFVTSLIIHASVSHLCSNMPIFVLLSWSLERRYAWWRVAPLYLLAGIVGNLYSAVYEDCAIVIGASGAVFGMLGAMLVDMLKCPTTMRLLLPRIFLCVFSSVQLIFSVVDVRPSPGRGGDGARAPRFTALPARAQAGTTSYWSHIGGFLTGTAMALLILPRPANARYVPLPVRALIVTAACGACLRTRAVTPPLPPPPSPV